MRWLSSWWLTATHLKCPMKIIIFRLHCRNIQYLDVCGTRQERTSERWDCGYKLRCRWLGLLPGRAAQLSSGNFTLTKATTSRANPIAPWCAISDLESPASMNTCSPQGNHGPPQPCGLHSLAMFTRSAMWTRSDYVPRETNCGDLDWEKAG